MRWLSQGRVLGVAGLGAAGLGAMLAALAPGAARAACVLTGTTVTCTEQDDDGIVAGNGVSVTVAPGAFVQSFYDGFDPDVCAGFRSAITVGRGASIVNRGTLLGRGNCSLGIEAGDTLTLTNEGDIRTGDNLSFAILAGNTFDVANRGRIATLNFGSTAFIGGGNGRLVNAVGAAIETGGADSAAVFAENGNTVVNDGRIVTGNLGSIGIDVGASNTIANGGTIATTGVASPGIRLRGSGNTVTNRGTITAIPLATSRAGEDSIGIVAEVGGNVITNSGTIAGDYAGVLLAGANNQLTNSGTISVRAPSTPSGPARAVVVGAGSATIVNSGTIRGAVGAGAGGSFALDNTGRIEGDVTIGASSSLTGNGTITGLLFNNGLLAPGPGIGTMTVAGNLTLFGNSRLEIDAAATGADRVNFGGSASLSGRVVVTYGGAPVRNGQVLTILAPSQTAFAATMISPLLSDNSPVFIGSSLRVGTTGVELVVSRTPYASVAQGAAELSVAQALDRALPTATAAAGAIYAALDQSDVAAARALFGQLAVPVPAALATWGVLAGTTLAATVSPWLELAPADSPKGQWRAWGGVALRDGESGGGAAPGHFDYDMKGAVAALDRAVVDGTRLGLAVSHTEGEEFLASGAAHADLEMQSIGAYISQAWPKWRAGAGIFFGEGNARASRTQTLGAAVSGVASATDMKTQTLFVQASHAMGTETWLVKPTAMLSHVRSTVDAYAESSAIGLSVDRQRATALRGDVGGRALAKAGPVHIAVGVFWSQNFKDNDRGARTRFNNLPGSEFTVFGPAEKRGWLNAQVGANIEIIPGMMARVGWSGILNDRMGGHTASAGLSYRW